MLPIGEKQHVPSLSCGGSVDQYLYTVWFTNQAQSPACILCFGVDHTSDQCPTNTTIPLLGQIQAPMQNTGQQHTASMSHPCPKAMQMGHATLLTSNGNCVATIRRSTVPLQPVQVRTCLQKLPRGTPSFPVSKAVTQKAPLLAPKCRVQESFQASPPD